MLNGIIENEGRKKYKNTPFDHITGLCQWCHEPVMFSNSIDEIIDGHIIQFHKKCYDKNCRIR